MRKTLLCISPFENSNEAITIDALLLQNGETAIVLEGKVTITKDQQGLEYAFALKRQIDTIVDKLKREDLPLVLNT